MTWNVTNGDCLEVLATLPECSIDAVVTDPPYELGFMGKKWDSTGIAYRVDLWRQVLRVLKPGGHLLAFSGSRTYHRMAVAIEDAGFEIRDQIMWVYGSGFPKSLDVSKVFDRVAGAEREVVGSYRGACKSNNCGTSFNASKSNKKGQTYVLITAPATDLAKQWQGWGTALKPAHEPIVMARKPLIGTVAETVQAHGTGAVNVDGTRLDCNRWPANLIHDGSPEVVAYFPDGAARFFYCPKAGKADRAEGNNHPTVKPTDLMRYLCRLVTPPGGTVLDPFTGSGSTGKASVMEGFNFQGIERETEYAEIARARINHAEQESISSGSGGKCGCGLSGGCGNPGCGFPTDGNRSKPKPECGARLNLHSGKPGPKLSAPKAVQLELFA